MKYEEFTSIRFERDGDVLRVVLDRPGDDLNAVDDRLSVGGKIDAQRMPLGIDERPGCLDRSLDDRAQRRSLLTQFQPTARNARDIQQIVQQQRHVLHLAFDDILAPALLRLSCLRHLRNRGRLANRRERISQFVCKGG